MQNKITRYEKGKDKDGKIISIFLAVSVSDQGESITKEYFLSEDERVLVLQDETKIKPIIEKMVAEGEIDLAEMLTNKPQPIEIATETKKSSLVPTRTKIDKAKVEVVKERKEKKEKEEEEERLRKEKEAKEKESKDDITKNNINEDEDK
jgi:hypothetical protein